MIQHPETWILNGILFSQNENRSVLKAHVQVIDGTITAITTKLPKRFSRNSTVINANGLTIFPGFIQAHVHLCQTLFRNQADDLELLDWLSKRIWVMESAHTEETLYTSALMGIHELLSSGTTCILDMGTVRHTNSILTAVQETGIRASVGKCLMDHPTQTPPSLRESTQKALNEALVLYEQWNGKENDRIRISYAPRFAISCTEKLLKRVAHVSLEQDALIHTHACENLKEVELVKKLFRLENIEYLHHLKLTSSRLVLAHCVWLNEIEKQILENTGTHVVHCPSSNLKLASGIAPIPEYRKRGINVALGADGAPCNNSLNIFQELRLAALIHKPGSGPRAMRAQEVLDMATRDGAKALNWWDEIGSIEIGKAADLVALDLNTPTNTVPESERLNPEFIASSTVYSSQPCHVRWTMVDGKMVYADGKVQNISGKSLTKQIHEANRIIGQRMKKI
jgi:5-methylthioadenosine/S-adenosylhomocysteine deaminase